jgi:hypothetical protein
MADAPLFPPVIDVTEGDPYSNVDVRAAKPVRAAGQWADWAAATTWCLAKGGTLVTAGPCSGAVPGGSQTYRFWLHPRAQIYARQWCVSLAMMNATVASHHATGTIQAPTGTDLGRFSITPDDFNKTKAFRFIQVLGSPNATPAETTFRLIVDAGSGLPGVYMVGVSCYELRRVSVGVFGGATTSVTGASTVQVGAPIRGRGFGASSVDGLLTNSIDRTLLHVETRRSTLFDSYIPAGQIVGTTYTNLFAVNPTVLARPMLGNDWTTIAISAYGSGPVGSNVRFSALRSGDSTTLALPTSAGWVHGLLQVDSEFAGTWQVDGGLRGTSDRDEIQIEAQRIGVGTCAVFGIKMAESVATSD